MHYVIMYVEIIAVLKIELQYVAWFAVVNSTHDALIPLGFTSCNTLLYSLNTTANHAAITLYQSDENQSEFKGISDMIQMDFRGFSDDYQGVFWETSRAVSRGSQMLFTGFQISESDTHRNVFRV